MSADDSSPTPARRRPAELGASIAALAGSPGGAPGAFTWLDGGAEARGFFGFEVDEVVEADSLDALHAVDAAWRSDPERVWMGWLTYDVGADTLLGRVPRRGPLPGLVARRFRAAWELAPGAPPRGHGDAAGLRRIEAALASVRLDATEPRWPFGPLRAAWSPQVYREKVAAAIEHIRAGDTYQVNLSQVFEAAFLPAQRPGGAAARHGSSLDAVAASAFRRLRRRTPARMGALIKVRPGAWIVSNSPETLFDLRRASSEIRSWPIKGTRPRAAQAAADEAAAEALTRSEKDRAEHVMIVDLVRNDLGRIATPGSVRVAGPPALVRLPTVHHLVSEVRATLPASVGLPEVVEALFPGGSITGAPKRRTVEIIDALEGGPRSIYCGAIFVLEPTGVRVSIPIRTALLSGQGLWLRSGGGVVADSDPEEERRETVAKARAFQP